MKRIIQIVALLVALSAITFWAAKGANRGWTKDSEPKKTMDEVTGIEGITYEKKFLPGLDILGGALLGSGILAGASLLIRNKPKTKNESPV